MTTRRSFSSQEKLDIVNEGMQPGANVTEICRRHGMGTSLFYYWKRQAMNGAADAIRGPDRNTVALKQENARLKKLVAEQALVIDRLKEFNESVRRGKTCRGGHQTNDCRR